MISVESLTKNYGPFRAVDNASFTVERGETIGFLGPNGAGKTTTMRMMTGLFPPSSGDIKLDGYSISEDPLEVKRRIGYLPESAPVYLDMTVEQYLGFVANAKGVVKKNKKEQIEKAMEACSLHEMRRRTARKLSKGYRQRLGLAQALVGDPPVIILDEPTVGLDPTQTFEFRNLIQGLRGDRTIILSSHILPEVSMICDRVVIISKGRIVAQDTPDNLAKAAKSNSEFLYTMTGESESALQGIEAVSGVSSVSIEDREEENFKIRITAEAENDPRQGINRLIIEKGWNLLELSVVTAGLEDVFLNLVTREDKQGETT